MYGGYNAAALASHKPLWLLRGEARYGSDSLAGVALGEMSVRVKNGSIVAGTMDVLFSEVARVGPAGNAALATVARGAGWDDLAAELMVAGAGTDAERVAVAKSWGAAGVEVRPRVVVGERVPVRFTREVVGSPSRSYGFWRQMKYPTVTVDGERFRLGDWWWRGARHDAGDRTEFGLERFGAAAERRPSGGHGGRSA